ncbi:MAG: UPF0175 family protein [Eubacterium sp.]|nr:UPF0175 family protein [Eubacterium sp.]
MAVIQMEMPEEMVSFILSSDKDEQLKRNAMMLYPYVHDGIISHGRAAEILGIYKMDLIALYGSLGIPYIEMTSEEIDEELSIVNALKEEMV